MAETKDQLKARLKEMGCWQAYLDRREELVAAGNSSVTARKVAASEFAPDGGAEPGSGEPSSRPLVGQAEHYARMAETAKGLEASEQTVVRWVADNLVMPLESIDLDLVPSPTAVSMLAFARSAGGGRDFWNGLYAKLIPSRSQLEAASRFSDDGRDIHKMLDECDRAGAADGVDWAEVYSGSDGNGRVVLPVGSEGAGSEPPI